MSESEHLAPSEDPAPHGVVLSSATLLLDVYQRGIRIEAQNELIIAEQGRAAASRKEIYQQLAEMRVDVALLTSTVTRIAPIVDAGEIRRLERAGIMKLTKLGAQHMGKVTAAAGAALLGWLGWLLHDKLPELLLRLFK